MHSTKTNPVMFFLIVMVLALSTALIVVAHRQHRQEAAGAGQTKPASAKQLWHCGMHTQVIQDHPGDCPICHMALTPLNSPEQPVPDKKDRKVLYWWDPMLGPSSIANHPGTSAMGMEMVPVYADSAGPTVTIDPVLQQNMGVRTAAVSRGPLTKTVRTLGILELPEPGIHEISLKVGGWIDKLYVDQEGMHVQKGEPLFDLYSPDLEVAAQELIGAVKSQKALSADASEILRRESQGMADSSERKLRLWGVAEEEIDAISKADHPPTTIPFRSPATGHVEEKMIVQGSAVQPGMKLLRIVEHGSIWLEAQVYQEQLPFVKIDQQVLATVEGIPGRTFKGKISFLYPHLDHMTHTLTARITMDNPQFELKPGMYATAEIAAQPAKEALLVPREAVIDTGSRQIAFVDAGEGHFEPRIVRMGIMGDDDQVEILQGVAPGEMVVTSGQFLMDVESRTIEATRKLSDKSGGEENSEPGSVAPVVPEARDRTSAPTGLTPPGSDTPDQRPPKLDDVHSRQRQQMPMPMPIPEGKP